MQAGIVLLMALGGLVALGRSASAKDSGGTLPPTRPPKTNKDKSLPTDALSPELQAMVARALLLLTVDPVTGQVVGPVTASAIQQASSVAARLDAAGFPELAERLREFIKIAKSKLPPADKKVDIPKPDAVPPELWAKIEEALKLEQDPEKLKVLLGVMETYEPKSAQMDFAITLMKTKILQLEIAQETGDTLDEIDKTIPTPDGPSDPVIIPPVIPPVSPPVEPPETSIPPVEKTPNQRTAEAVRLHLLKLQGSNPNLKAVKGREDKTLIQQFQRQEGIKTDGLMGPGSMLLLAKYVSNLPLVMYWPKSATKNNVFDYRNKLFALAELARKNGDLQRAAELNDSANRERGQSGIVGPMA